MKNIEKYINEISSYLSDFNCDGICCTKCLFKEKRCGNTDEIKKWLLKEYEETITLTKAEHIILDCIDKGCKYIARDKDGDLGGFASKPCKVNEYWDCGDNQWSLHTFNHLFLFIKWENEKPYLIEDLLEMEIDDE